VFFYYQIECCIDEWTDGTYKTSNWNEDRYKTSYLSHMKSLTDLWDHEHPHGQGLLAQIQHDLLKEAWYALPLSMIDLFPLRVLHYKHTRGCPIRPCCAFGKAQT
jgi:Domain of unknown function (DUF6532)